MMRVIVLPIMVIILALCSSLAVANETMRPMVFRMLEGIQENIDEKNYQGAQEGLDKLGKMRRNQYEQGMTHMIEAYLYFSQDDYAAAIKSYESILALSVPDSLRETSLYSLAKLYLATENYSKSIESLRKWQSITKKASPESFMFLGQAYMQLNDDAMALREVQQGMALAREQGLMIRENWYLLERAIYYRKKDYQGLESNLKALAAHYPKAQYWLQLSAVYDELGKTQESLAVLETAYAIGYLQKENELMSFAGLLLQVDLPFKAAKVLEQAMKAGLVEENEKNLSLLADAWMLAKEYELATAALEKAVMQTDDADLAYKLAQVYLEKNNWSKSGELIGKALKSSKLRNPGHAYLIQGLSYFNQQNLDLAESAFKAAKRFDQQSHAAEQWLQYLQQERQRLQYIESLG